MFVTIAYETIRLRDEKPKYGFFSCTPVFPGGQEGNVTFYLSLKALSIIE